MSSSQQAFFDKYARGATTAPTSTGQTSSSSSYYSSSQGTTQNYTTQQTSYTATTGVTSQTNQTTSYSRNTPAVETSYTSSTYSRPIENTYTSSSSYTNVSSTRPAVQTNSYQIEGRKDEREGDLEGYLKWASTLNNDTIISGSSDYSQLANLKDAILELRSQYFNPKSGLSVIGQNRDELSRRFLLIEH